MYVLMNFFWMNHYTELSFEVEITSADKAP